MRKINALKKNAKKSKKLEDVDTLNLSDNNSQTSEVSSTISEQTKTLSKRLDTSKPVRSINQNSSEGDEISDDIVDVLKSITVERSDEWEEEEDISDFITEEY